jgi:hypothetical protein
MPQSVLHVVAEEVEEPHVADEVQPSVVRNGFVTKGQYASR